MRRMPRPRLLPVLVLTLAAALAGRPAAQEPDPAPAFEVASVKPSPTRPGHMMTMGIRPQGERFTASHVPLATLISNAHQLKIKQIIGLPDWAMAEFFDIQAKAPAGTQLAMQMGGGGNLAPMLRHLLAERFGLKTHRETRELPVYAVVKARDDGRLGPGIVPSRTDCEALMKAARAAGGPPPFSPPKPGERPPCGMMTGPGLVRSGGMPIANFMTMLENQAGRIVVDRTGLTGTFDIDLTWTPDFIANRPAGSPPPPPGFNGQTVDPNGPTLFTAIQEQLGLKLEATKAPVEVLVIDSVSRPTPD